MTIRRTKIIATVGPASSSEEMIERLVNAGVNVLRLNFSHGTHAEHETVIRRIQEVRSRMGRPLGIMLDTKGPEMRTGEMEGIHVLPEQMIRLVVKTEKPGDIEIQPSFVLDEIESGMEILFDDGYVNGQVTRVGKGFADVKIYNEGWIKRHKGINIPEGKFSLPFLTEQDIQDIAFGVKMGVDMIAASFIMSVEHVLAIKELLQELGRSDILVIGKIESRHGVEAFDKILQVCDGIMIARGDLGVELPIASIPNLQKMMIRKCNEHAKIAIVATQMLESMIQHPRPTRAEATDIANGVHDGATAVMLSGETAVGKYPIEAVKMMDQVIVAAESTFAYEEYFHARRFLCYHDIPSGVALAAVNTSYSLGASAIVVCSNGGHTARRLCRYRPRPLVIVVTPSIVTYHQMSIVWGTVAIIERGKHIEEEFFYIASHAMQQGWVNFGDLVVLTSGKPYGKSFTTNTIMVESIGKVRVRGIASELAPKEEVTGEIVFLITNHPDETASYEGKIIVISQYREDYRSALKAAKGIVLQNSLQDDASIEALYKLFEEGGPPFIYQADGAFSLLNVGEAACLNPKLGLVFSADSPTKEMMLKTSMKHH